MISGWCLPTTAVIGGREYRLHGDYRDILEIFAYLEDPELPEAFRWQIALGLFYEEELPQKDQQEAMTYLAAFLNGGRRECGQPGPKLLDWQQDAPIIAAEVNKAAGQEIRALPFLHWWTFLSFFHAIGQGQLSSIVAIRDKLHRGKSLEPWEKEFYRANREQVELKKCYTRQEQVARQQLLALLDGKEISQKNGQVKQ